MGKSDKYEIVEGTNSIDFCRAVQRRIDAGWELVGGASISSTRTSMAYAQAMIYREPIVLGLREGETFKPMMPPEDGWQIQKKPPGKNGNIYRFRIFKDAANGDIARIISQYGVCMSARGRDGYPFKNLQEAQAALDKWRMKNKE